MVNTKNQKWIATGRRKSSIARVELKSGKGQFLVNGRDFDEYFNRDTQKMIIKRPFDLLELNNQYDINADLNLDLTVDVLDVVQLVNIILN